MTVGEVVTKLRGAEGVDYNNARLSISDDFINFIQTMMPYDYEDIREKEENYQKLIKNLAEGLKELKD